MPLWKVSLYGQVMPKFYVNVFFFEVASEEMYIGGEPTQEFVRISIEHIARRMSSEKAKRFIIDKVNELIAPWVKERGFDWEFHIDETPFELWSVQGYFPPREGTPDEKRWMAENRPSPRTHD